MVTETLLNSLKSLFSSLGAKTSDSNYAVGLFDKTSGEPKGLMGMSALASVLGGQLKRELNVFMKMTANGTPQTHTIPGKPVCLLFGITVSTSDNITAENTQKTDLIVPTSSALNEYWCGISGNTITFNFPGYAGSNYGAVKFDVLYI